MKTMEREEYFQEIIRVMSTINNSEFKIEVVAGKIIELYQNKGILIIAGNGGSAADAQHIAAEMMGAYMNRNRKALPAIALTANTSNLTAIGNDYGYEEVFVRQLQAFDDFNYIFIGISTSGNSPNINKAIEYAKSKGKFTVWLTGRDGGTLQKIADLCIIVPCQLTPIIQTAHNSIYHRICELVESAFSSKV